MKKTILITGAGQRIGAALAEHAARQHHHLVLHAHRSIAQARALAASLARAHGISAQAVAADLSDPAALEDFWHGLPPVTDLVHNAALFTRDTLASMDPALLQRQMQVNFLAPLQLTQGFMAQLPAEVTGSVTVLGDGVMGWSISPEFFSYAASKQAWAGTLDLLAAACAPRVRVNLLALAPTLPNDADTPELFDRLAARAPLQRNGTPAEVCAAWDYVLHAPGVTGQILSLAGGAQLQSHRRRD